MFSITSGIDKMVKVYNTQPNFLKYGNTDGISRDLNNYFNDKKLCGGLITQSTVKYKYGAVKLPSIKTLINKDKLNINGFFKIKGIQISIKDKSKFMDLEILTMKPTHWTDLK